MSLSIRGWVYVIKHSNTSKLNERQKTVAENYADNLLMLAPAGTGKTNTIAVRIANIIQAGHARPDEILCLTFTNRACKEMRERVASIAGELSIGVIVKTIHAFAYLLLREFGKMSNTSEMGICDDEDSIEYIIEILTANYPVKDEERLKNTARKLASLFEMAKHHMYRSHTRDLAAAIAITIKQESIREKLCGDGGYEENERMYRFLVRDSAKVMTLYQKLLSERNLYDFHDLILEMGRLTENDDIRALLRGRFRYVHIDEVQDISDVEYDILTKMFPEAVFLLCGDANQTIYGWRGSVPDIILPRFIKEFNAKRISLIHNYRSTPGLINIGERFLHSGRASSEPPPRIYTEDDVVIQRFEDEADQTAWLYDTVKRLDVAGDYSKVAVLCRSNGQCERISRGFFSLNQQESGAAVNFMLVEEFKIFRTKEIKDILAFMGLAVNRCGYSALLRVAERYFRLSRKTLGDVIALKETAGVRLTDFIHPTTQDAGDYFSLLEQALADGQAVVFDVESTGVDKYVDEIIQVAAIRIGKNAQIYESFEEYIRPTKPVGDSEKTHGISDAELARKGKPARDVLQRLAVFLTDKVVIGHNIEYDMDILGAELNRHGLQALRVKGVYDTLEIARRYLPDLENHKLETLAVYFKTAHKPSHDAMEDIRATADVLIALNTQFIVPTTAARTLAYRQYAHLFAGIRQSVDSLQSLAPILTIAELCARIIEAFYIKEKYADNPARIGNIEEFASFMHDSVFKLGWWRRDIATALEYASLSSSEFEKLSKAAKKMSIITVHQAKGCEFDYVFLPSLIEYTFPSYQSIKTGGERGRNEEARLFYVAITRAKKKLFMSWYESEPGKERRKEKSGFLNKI
jgi:DNA helicase-2/ATP-dependent DNA helicase PcrA